ncbi:MAG: pantoate--beta-alanine ligase [Planctomycetes bacterium GWF2_41_51]|nr:MAG: pantoate--beta-alanine ligase [Planctomycetes bacterium GWF2_41_51]HBG27590.1 pantoate--beta-alanine ligase [Phycisphaerales bacterium]
MQIAKTIEDIKMIISEAGSFGKKIGFVPTMGALHAGHISLIKKAKQQTEFVVVSIFVNPTQFGPNEDIDKYPRPFEADLEICKHNGADAVFAPSAQEMYPQKNLTWINVEKLSESLCGKTRPNHFRGVATVCAKLFNIVQPDVAYFGQKDAQQVIVIKRMIADLNLPLRIVVCPTVRESDGLAMSSRNKYLNAEQRKDAPLLYAALQEAEIFIKAGERKSDFLKEQIKKILNISSQIAIDYISIVNADTLDEIDEVKGKVLIALAVKLGPARLIDNILLDVK